MLLNLFGTREILETKGKFSNFTPVYVLNSVYSEAQPEELPDPAIFIISERRGPESNNADGLLILVQYA